MKKNISIAFLLLTTASGSSFGQIYRSTIPDHSPIYRQVQIQGIRSEGLKFSFETVSSRLFSEMSDTLDPEDTRSSSKMEITH